MIRIEHANVYGFEAAFRGMRNPMNSWEKSDSVLCPRKPSFDECDKHGNLYNVCPRQEFDSEFFCIGRSDMALAKKLVKAGSDHRKFLRQIFLSVDITAPLYFWKEFDTYKVGTAANSCSTMHKIHETFFTLDDFSCEHIGNGRAFRALNEAIQSLNASRKAFLETGDKAYWWEMIQLLPSSYNQRRTVTLNYEVLLNMYKARNAHKLDEWRTLCEWAKSLPYFKEMCLEV